jgi:predicted nucleotide-binding protein
VGLASALNEHYNGKAAPHELATAMSISPTSSGWQSLTGAAVGYGLTAGGYNADAISLTDLGRRIVAPQAEGDDVRALGEAALKPRVLRQFFEKYNRGKFPQEQIGMNVLISLGVPKDRAKSVYEIALDSGKRSGFVTKTTSGLYVALTPASARATAKETGAAEPEAEEVDEAEKPLTIQKASEASGVNVRVFITHGKDKAFVDQLKEILRFGKFDPVVAVEHETLSKPVPDKVMDDMRSCFAAVIHVDSEQELIDGAGNKVHKINDNVLIEIGAALALFDHNFVLLVKKGVTLPSNLQGLYCCYYEGDKLDYEATMKLLKAFNEFER